MLIIMASHGRAGLSRWARGSVTEAVLRRSSTPVLTLTPTSLAALDDVGPRFARILVADDGSARALAALHPALTIARAHRGEVTLFGVAAEGDAEALAAALTDHARIGEEAGVVVRVEVALGPSPAAELLRAAASADLVATLVTLGTPHGGSHAARYLATDHLRALRPDSPLMTRLAAGAPWSGSTRLVCFWSRADVLLLPCTTARVEGAENHELEGVTHYGYLLRPECWRRVFDVLER